MLKNLLVINNYRLCATVLTVVWCGVTSAKLVKKNRITNYFINFVQTHVSMNKVFSLIAIAILATSCFPHGKFHFIQMTDPQIGFIDPTPGYQKTDSLLQRAVAEANTLKPAAVIVTGDLVNNPTDSLQLAIYRRDAGRLQAPVYELPGNHDPESGRRFFFRKKGCSFIGLDSNPIIFGPQEKREEQKEWLTARLQEARGSRFIFVFLHCPIFRETPDETEDYFNFPLKQRMEYLNLFREYGVSAVFSGHTHAYYHAEWNDIQLYTAGPTGIPLGQGKTEFLLINVNRDHFTVTEHLLP